MAYGIEKTDEFAEWFRSLTDKEREAVDSYILLLEARGPFLKFPYCRPLESSKVPGLMELRPTCFSVELRPLYVFDPRRTAILLVGGQKGAKHFYKRIIKEAERIYAQYLDEIRKEVLL